MTLPADFETGFPTKGVNHELSVTASTEKKFELQNRIEECQREIKRLEGTLKSPDKDSESYLEQPKVQSASPSQPESKVGLGSEKGLKKSGITWIHLSDWHKKGREFDKKVVGKALIEDIRQREQISPELKQVDFIVFSGDLAFSGKKEEYEAAKPHLLAPVLEAKELKPKHLFMVPGNHDLDREEFDLLPKDLLKPFESDQEVQKWLTNEKKRQRLLEPTGQNRG